MDFYQLKVHFIGIGGIGVSGLARFLKAQGAIISGSDIHDTSITQTLKNEGICINIPHSKDVIASKDLIIHSAIIKNSNIEIMEAKKLNKTILSRKEALKILLSKKKVLSVCAAHGKSSTSAILASILSNSGAIIGAISKEFKSNVRVSNKDIIVFEADESDKSFLNSNPYKSIVINAEAEHLESYDNDFLKLQDAYMDFIKLSKHSILNLECNIVKNMYEKLQQEKKSNKNIPDIICLNPENDIKNISYVIKDSMPFTNFELKDWGKFSVYGIGYHNAINASMAILSSIDLLTIQDIKKNMLNFRGIKKRFDILQHLKEDRPCIIDDYAHHPTEIRATLGATKIYANLLRQTFDFTNSAYKIIAIFQPHKYSRLRNNLQAFCECFVDCDELIILPVWAAGEEKIDFDFRFLFNSYNLSFAEKLKRDGSNIILLDSNNNKIRTLSKGIIVGLGAGDITYQLRGE